MPHADPLAGAHSFTMSLFAKKSSGFKNDAKLGGRRNPRIAISTIYSRKLRVESNLQFWRVLAVRIDLTKIIDFYFEKKKRKELSELGFCEGPNDLNAVDCFFFEYSNTIKREFNRTGKKDNLKEQVKIFVLWNSLRRQTP